MAHFIYFHFIPCGCEEKLKQFISSEIYIYNPGNFSDTQNLCEKIKSDLIDDLLRIYSKELKIISEKENVEYSRRNTLISNSTYGFFHLGELLSIDKEEEIKNLSIDQLVALSTSLIENNGNYKIGLAPIELATLKEPDNWILHNNRGLILETMGLDEAAFFSYNKSIELNKNNDTGYYSIGIIYFRQSKYEDAIKYFRFYSIPDLYY
jgi:tetratricopeptide (TPR) repeat protein